MKDLIINRDERPIYVPEVVFKVEDGHGIIGGESYMEEPFELYGEIIDWCKEYASSQKKPLTVEFELAYVNSSSFRALLDCLKSLKELQEQGHGITINWRYPEDDVNDIQEEGEDLAFDAEMEMNFVAY